MTLSFLLGFLPAFFTSLSLTEISNSKTLKSYQMKGWWKLKPTKKQKKKLSLLALAVCPNGSKPEELVSSAVPCVGSTVGPTMK